MNNNCSKCKKESDIIYLGKNLCWDHWKSLCNKEKNYIESSIECDKILVSFDLSKDF